MDLRRQNDKLSDIEVEMINYIEKEVKKVLLGNKKEFRCWFGYPDLIIDYIKTLGGNLSKKEIDTNGWGYDYWVSFYYNGIKYMISGSGYYGGINFCKDE